MQLLEGDVERLAMRTAGLLVISDARDSEPVAPSG